ncbi:MULTISPECIES: hypothetical protein [unclassified Enterococcus]|uniref:hypothetical protein n=1 Tax=unclassified Enterococcus TaxID=2608891 RepID=UPI0013EA8229|nr:MULTISPECIES: hypothetical protein [unclassified Enterococcus]
MYWILMKERGYWSSSKNSLFFTREFDDLKNKKEEYKQESRDENVMVKKCS